MVVTTTIIAKATLSGSGVMELTSIAQRVWACVRLFGWVGLGFGSWACVSCWWSGLRNAYGKDGLWNRVWFL